jgi:pSer/pThr/pTyr-binding forkhead associated (FHA) protein
MGSALVVAIAKYGLLALLWVFVLVAVRTVRVDLWGRPDEKKTKQPKPVKAGRRSAHSLVVTEGPLAGTTLALGDADVTLGRGDSCTLVLDDDYASTRHARLTLSDQGWTVEDLGSTNGTYLGRDRITRPTRVPLNTPIKIGTTSLELRV